MLLLNSIIVIKASMFSKGQHILYHAINPNANSIMVNDDEKAENVALEKEEKAKQELISRPLKRYNHLIINIL